MQRIPTLLQKLNELSKSDKISALELDLMLDYTRVLYADLLEWRNRVAFTSSLEEAPGPSTNIDDDKPAIPVNTAPPIELTGNAENYNAPKDDNYTSQTSTGHDIRKLIGINDKYQYISELFGNDKAAYEEVMDKINQFQHYQQSIEWLDEHAHTIYAWDDESFTVQSFYNTVSNFFASK